MTEAHVFVDQIEGDMAVLVEGTEEHPIPLHDLPEGVQEGDWLTLEIPAPHSFFSFLLAVQDGEEGTLNFVRDVTTGEAVKKRVQDLMDELSG